MKYHLISFVLGFILDLCVGDPYVFPHPIRWIGRLIGGLEKRLLGDEADTISDRRKAARGIWLVLIVCLITSVAAAGMLLGAYLLHPVLGAALETIMTYQLLATKCLKDESMKVYDALNMRGLEEGRKAVSMIVGRDTECLDKEGVIKATVETIAENTSDGVIAPMIYTALGGPMLGFLYKAVNTMDSMVGYKNDRYLYFGRAAAKVDDVCNFLPSRISAYLMMVACIFLGKEFDMKKAFCIHKRDARKHASPNAAQTESTCAGALGIQLAGNATYFGVVHEKPDIGDAMRPIAPDDIKRANRLLYVTAILSELLCAALLALCH